MERNDQKRELDCISPGKKSLVPKFNHEVLGISCIIGIPSGLAAMGLHSNSPLAMIIHIYLFS